jgi:Phosphotyrosyl phosphate activator (PTPA) protein
MTNDEYVVPTKKIVSPSDLHAFLHSDAYTMVNTFIEDLSASVEDTPISPDLKTSAVMSTETIADYRMWMYYWVY